MLCIRLSLLTNWSFSSRGGRSWCRYELYQGHPGCIVRGEAERVHRDERRVIHAWACRDGDHALDWRLLMV